MHDSKEQVADVNHFDNKIVVKYEDGGILLLDAADVRRDKEAASLAGETTSPKRLLEQAVAER